MGKAEDLRELTRQTRLRVSALDVLRTQQRVITAQSEHRLLLSRRLLTTGAWGDPTG